MSSVMDIIELVAEAEHLAATHDYRTLQEILRGIDNEVATVDPTLLYLLAYAEYMLGEELAAARRLETVSVDPRLKRSERLYRRMLNLRAVLEVEMGNLEVANELLAELELLAQTAADMRYLAYASLNRSIALDIAGLHTQATNSLRRAQAAFERIGDLDAVAACRHNTAMALRHLGRYDQAEVLFTEAAEYFLHKGSAERRLAAEIERALCMALSGDLPRAFPAAVRAYDEAAELDNGRLRTEAARVLGTIHRLTGHLQTASELLTEALEFTKSNHLKLVQAEVLLELAQLPDTRHPYGSREEVLGKAAEIFRAMGAEARARRVEML